MVIISLYFESKLSKISYTSDIPDKSKFKRVISDITFSSNDLALNTLLNLLPHKITIHLVDGFQDEFIETLKLIFQDKITICEDCDICNMYRYTKIKL